MNLISLSNSGLLLPTLQTTNRLLWLRSTQLQAALLFFFSPERYTVKRIAELSGGLFLSSPHGAEGPWDFHPLHSTTKTEISVTSMTASHYLAGKSDLALDSALYGRCSEEHPAKSGVVLDYASVRFNYCTFLMRRPK